MISEKYLDRYGNILPLPKEMISAKPEQSENPSKINADYWAKKHQGQDYKLTGKQRACVQNVIVHKWWNQEDAELRTMEHDDNKGFSLDEAVGIAVMAKIVNDLATMSKIRVYKYWYRFYDIVPFLLIMKYPKLKWLGFLQTSLWVTTPLSCLFGFRKSFPFLGVLPNSDTSGRCLAYLKCRGLGSEKLQKICEKVMSLKQTSFRKNYAYYYGYYRSFLNERTRITLEDHPVNELWKQ